MSVLLVTMCYILDFAKVSDEDDIFQDYNSKMDWNVQLQLCHNSTKTKDIKYAKNYTAIVYETSEIAWKCQNLLRNSYKHNLEYLKSSVISRYM